jgi:Subtilase family
MMNEHSEHLPNEPLPGDDGPSEEKQPPAQHRHPKEYFLPGKMIVHVEHSAGFTDINFAELARSIDNVTEEQGFEGRLIKRVQPRNILTFPRRDDQGSAFSIVPIELDSKAPLVQTIVDLEKRLRTAGPIDLGQGSSLQTISPNWLLGSAGHGGVIPPTPGSWPLVRTSPREEDLKFSLVAKDSKETSELPFAAEQGAGVHIAILDTAPCARDLDEAYELWHVESGLIDELLKPEPARKLRLVTDIYAEIELLEFSLARHRYWMPDHGLFIAGEIASIAPQAKIHLIKVFTSYGAASVLTLAQGLLRVLTDDEIGRPLIVNCSFGLSAPVPGQEDPDFPVELHDPETFERMQTSLRALFDELTNQNEVIVVAAAGDDTEPGKQRAPARLPAAYENVIGVGAMPKLSNSAVSPFPTASYSNLADNPPSDGFVTLGGEAGPGKGVFGTYISQSPHFPGESGGNPPVDPAEAKREHLTYRANLQGSAEWAGASFAAPIITGILANWCSQHIGTGTLINLANARQALIDISQSTTTAEGEHVILVNQG